MMRAAIYARRSTEEHQAESLETQIDGGRRFAASHGWTVDDAHVYVDSGISRAEFVKRRGLGSMLAAADAKAFEIVVTRDETRLGGDMLRTGLLIQNLADAGARLFYYATGEEVRGDDSTSRLVIAVRNYSAELEREKVSSRTRENLERKARRGLVAGGAVYGYRVIVTPAGKAYEIEPAEAEIIRELFTRYAGGEGLRTIAHSLNARRVPAPRAGRRGSGSWSFTSIREMVRRERYRGTLVWGQREKAYRRGTKVRLLRPASDWITIEVPELRLVPEELWAAVAARAVKRARLTTSRAVGTRTRYLLSGIGRCAACGGPMQVTHGRFGRETVNVYACAWRRDRGPEVCGNTLRRPVAGVDAVVLAHLRAGVLQEDIVVDVIRGLRRVLVERSKHGVSEAPALERRARELRVEIERLAGSLLGADAKPKSVMRLLTEREAMLAEVEGLLAAQHTLPAVHDLEAHRLEREARKRLQQLDVEFERAPEHARALLESVLGGPILFTAVELPEGRRYRVEGTIALSSLLAVDAGVVQMASPAGTVRYDTRLPWACTA